MSCNFKTITHGKWILAGEHAVIRGHSALVFPLTDKTLTLKYTKNQNPLKIDAHLYEHDPNSTHDLLQNLIQYGLKCIQQTAIKLTGHLQIESNIPVGVGMGASAALCVAITRWFIAQNWINAQDEFSVARELEHLFHGQSSGLDILGVSSTRGMYFQNGRGTPLQETWSPNWQLSFCGEQGPTAHCIHSVQRLWHADRELAKAIDQQMQKAVMGAKQALEAPFTATSLHLLTESIQQASLCFQNWGLITPVLDKHMQALQMKGALAVKPTGSGKGGYVASLWAPNNML